MNIQNYFWAKTTSEGKPGISVLEHMINVGNVAQSISESSIDFLNRFNLSSEEIGALAALHDLGKISPGFQMKCDEWLHENHFYEIAQKNVWDTQMETDHGKVTHSALQSFLNETSIDGNIAKYVSAVLGAHHGRLNPPNDRGFKPRGAITETKTGIDWNNERKLAAKAIWELFKVCDINGLRDDSPALWWLAGLTSVADWIGSDERFFSSAKQVESISKKAITLHALDLIGFRNPKIKEGLTFHDLFHDTNSPDVQWVPNEMQEKTVHMITGPGVYVIEAPMGMGKTEAAQWAAYHLLVNGLAKGIYFALPTQATSNRIHIRMNEFVKRISPECNGSRLIHGNSWLMDQYVALATSTTFSGNNEDGVGRDWFCSAKRSMLAPFGVGTIDQALLGIVASKHFFVRHFALAGKVVIIDEVHSYDLYTGTLVDKLVKTLEELGCTVIILSATLTEKRRNQLVSNNVFDEQKTAETPYPLLTGRKNWIQLDPISSPQPESRDIAVHFKSLDVAADNAIELASKGGCVLWICNTIDNAQKQFEHLQKLAGNRFPVGLIHSRFPFWKREVLENEWMERFGKSGKTRCGSILVSTQIVEQSVDLDADLMITELAPTDMLLQRLGRLWRHTRKRPYNIKPKIVLISESKTISELREMSQKDIVECLGGKAHVYDPFVLLRTLQIWLQKDNSIVKIPDKIRELLESTYKERDDDPKSWTKLFDERFIRNSNERFKATMSSNYWQLQLPDEEGVQTRLNDAPTLSLILCTSKTPLNVTFIDGTSVLIGKEEYNLQIAQFIHKNIVKVPQYCFEIVKEFEPFTAYLHGAQTIGIVSSNGTVEVKGLKIDVELFYSNELGLVIKKNKEDI